jgi:hypothetical protein
LFIASSAFIQEQTQNGNDFSAVTVEVGAAFLVFTPLTAATLTLIVFKEELVSVICHVRM